MKHQANSQLALQVALQSSETQIQFPPRDQRIPLYVLLISSILPSSNPNGKKNQRSEVLSQCKKGGNWPQKEKERELQRFEEKKTEAGNQDVSYSSRCVNMPWCSEGNIIIRFWTLLLVKNEYFYSKSFNVTKKSTGVDAIPITLFTSLKSSDSSKIRRKRVRPIPTFPGGVLLRWFETS